MFRALLVAYLSFVTVLGPASCCCQARQVLTDLVGLRGEIGGATVSTGHATLHGRSHSGKKRSTCCRHARLKRPDAGPLRSHVASLDAPGASHESHEHGDCACGRARASAASTGSQHSGFTESTTGDSSAAPAFIFGLPGQLPLLQTIALHGACRLRSESADLYGRDLLRAYQILRC